jgi:hypothetical protein
MGPGVRRDDDVEGGKEAISRSWYYSARFHKINSDRQRFFNRFALSLDHLGEHHDARRLLEIG